MMSEKSLLGTNADLVRALYRTEASDIDTYGRLILTAVIGMDETG
jgi:hypothetical protein